MGYITMTVVQMSTIQTIESQSTIQSIKVTHFTKLLIYNAHSALIFFWAKFWVSLGHQEALS